MVCFQQNLSLRNVQHNFWLQNLLCPLWNNEEQSFFSVYLHTLFPILQGIKLTLGDEAWLISTNAATLYDLRQQRLWFQKKYLVVSFQDPTSCPMSIKLSNLILAFLAYLIFQEFILLSRRSSIHLDQFHFTSFVTWYKFA